MSASTNPEKTASEKLSDILNDIDLEKLDELPDDKIIELRKKLNPYGRTIEGSNNILTFSYTDLRKEYLKKFLVTGIVGFLNRMCDEWNVPDGIPVTPVYDHTQDPEKINEFEKTLTNPEILADDIAKNKEWMKKRVVVKEFLEDMFQYNPDMHVRSGYRPQPNDEERKILETPAAKLAISQGKAKDPSFNSDMLQHERNELNKEKTNSETLPGTTKDVTEMIPPEDIFHRYQHYMDTNYEELKECVNDLYCYKADLETAINPYSWHKNSDDADKFINKHKNEVISSVFKAESGKWNIFSSYKTVRDSMRYFNEKTIVLEEILKQQERDSKIGEELMKNRIKIKKKQNIKNDGPDDPAFAKWKEGNQTLKNMGAETLGKDAYNDECPDDALEVPVYRISGGGTSIEKTKFFTKAIAPESKE
jgi:hypothetical protein